MTINGDQFYWSNEESESMWLEDYHLHLFHMKMESFDRNPNKAISEQKWNHAELELGCELEKWGIHVLKENSNDVRFMNSTL